MTRSLMLVMCVGLCVLSSACFIGRRGRNLDRAVEHTYECAAPEGYRYENLGPDRYRVRACYDRSAKRYRHRAVFHCSYRRCASLTQRAAETFSAASGCALEKVEARETTDPGTFHVVGCDSQTALRCEMKNNEVSCGAATPIAVIPISPIAPTAGGEVAPAKDAGL